MNSYFLKVIEETTSDAKIFVPPMAQDAFALKINMNGCGPMSLRDGTSGYEHIMDMIRASDGFSWHNYWHMGKEEYDRCREDGGGAHVSFHFPNFLKEHIRSSGKPTIITEADLLSKFQSGNVNTKEENKSAVAYSLQRFFYEEWRVGSRREHYGVEPNIALWTLNDNIYTEDQAPSDEKCTQAPEACENDHNWHEAYRDRPDGTMEEKKLV